MNYTHDAKTNIINHDNTEHGLSFMKLQETFRLCLESEALIRLKGRSNEVGMRIPFLHLGPDRYKHVRISGKKYLLHRIVWALAHGRWPGSGMQIDHIDRDTRNNHPDNLREVTASQNQRNRSANKITGLYGVYGRCKGYRVGVTRNGKRFMSRTIPDLSVAAFVSDVLRVLVYGQDDITIEQLNDDDRFALFFASAVNADDLPGAVETAVSACL